MPVSHDSNEAEAQLKAELESVRLRFQEAKREFAQAKELCQAIGVADTRKLAVRANQAYVDAMAAYRAVLDGWAKLVLGRKP